MSTKMSRLGALSLAVMLALAPAVADARPGLGGSMGSRGSRTYSAPPSTSSAPGGASPFQRSYTAPGNSYSNPGYSQNYGGYGYRRPSMFGGFFGGLLAGGLLGMVFGHGFFHGGFFGLFGLILQLVLIYWLVKFLFRSFGGQPAFAGMGGMARNMFGGPAQGGGYGGGYGNSAPRPAAGGRPLAIVRQDYEQFSQLLQGIQRAWSEHDLNGLRAMATPEMVTYFAEQLNEQVSQGLRNTVTDVRLLQGDLAEAWSEGSVDYATVSMRISMIDVTRDASGRVVDGSPTEHITVTEYWTFTRGQGGHWILSAIQQAR